MIDSEFRNAFFDDDTSGDDVAVVRDAYVAQLPRRSNFHTSLLPRRSSYYSSSRYAFVKSTARAEAERSCVPPSSNFHYQGHHHSPSVATSGIPWLSSTSSRPSVFAPLPGTPRTSSSSSLWAAQNGKNPSEVSCYPSSRPSPIKVENGSSNARSSVANSGSTPECGDGADPASANCAQLETGCEPRSSTSGSGSSQTPFHAFPTPPKDDGEANNPMPLTPSSAVSNTSSHHQPLLPSRQTSQQEPQTPSSLNGACQHPAHPSHPHQLYHQGGVESKHADHDLTSSSMLAYPHPYMTSRAGECGSGISGYHIPHENVKSNSTSSYTAKSKSKSRSTTGE